LNEIDFIENESSYIHVYGFKLTLYYV